MATTAGLRGISIVCTVRRVFDRLPPPLLVVVVPWILRQCPVVPFITINNRRRIIMMMVMWGLSRMQISGDTSVVMGAMKNPKAEELVGDSAVVALVVVTDTEEMEIEMWPVFVNPNSSNSIISRESSEILTVLMSAVVDGRWRRSRRERRRAKETWWWWVVVFCMLLDGYISTASGGRRLWWWWWRDRWNGDERKRMRNGGKMEAFVVMEKE